MIGNNLVRAISAVALLALISRCMGIVREAVIAKTFGVGPEVDAFFVAFRIPDTLYNSLVAIVIGACLTPVYMRRLEKDSVSGAYNLARETLFVTVVILLTFTVGSAIFAKPLVTLMAPGLSAESVNLAARMTVLLSPLFVLGGVIGLGRTILNAHGAHTLPAALPLIFNVVMISVVLVFGRHYGVGAMAAAVLAAAVIQFLFLIFSLWRRGFPFLPRIPRLRSPDIREVGHLALPIVLGLVVGNIMAVVEVWLASNLGTGSISAIGYAQRLFSVPDQLCAAIVSMVVFPILAADHARDDFKQLGARFTTGMRYTILLAFPIALAFIACKVEIIRLILGGGAFDTSDVTLTANVLGAFSVGLPALCVWHVVTFMFYTLRRSYVLVAIAAATIPLNIVLDLLFIPHYGVAGIALGGATTRWFMAAAAFVIVRRYVPVPDFAGIGGVTMKAVGASAASLVAVLLARRLFGDESVLQMNLVGVSSIGMALGSLVLLIYVGVLVALKTSELMAIWASMRTRLLRQGG